MGRIDTDKEKRVAQILATDTTREQLAEALWCAEDCVRRLVERVSLLNDKISKLRTEFDKMDKWHSAEFQAAMAENAKLRKVVARVERARRDLCDAYPDAELLNCEECPAWSECKGDLMDRMRELGVEV